MYTSSLAALAIAPLVFLASADVSLDRDNVPAACSTICEPIVELTRQCDTDLRGDDNDRDEDLLEAQCVCTNDSFDVSSIAALCADCIRQNPGGNDNDDDDDDDDRTENLRDMSDLMSTCGFASTSYAASASASGESISVSAARPTDASQLTTTMTPGSQPSASTDSSSATDSSTATATSDDGGATATDDAAATSSTSNAAAMPTHFGAAGAVVAGAMMLMV